MNTPQVRLAIATALLGVTVVIIAAIMPGTQYWLTIPGGFVAGFSVAYVVKELRTRGSAQ